MTEIRPLGKEDVYAPERNEPKCGFIRRDRVLSAAEWAKRFKFFSAKDKCELCKEWKESLDTENGWCHQCIINRAFGEVKKE